MAAGGLGALVGLDDRALMGRVVARDRRALGVLYRRHAGYLLGVGLRVVRCVQGAQDVVHDVFLEVWTRAEDFCGSRGSVRTWLALRMRSRCQDRVRSLTRAQERAKREHRRALRVPVRLPVERLDLPRVQQGLSRLAARERSVLELRYLRGLSTSETARVLGIPQGTVKSRSRLGLARLRAELG